MLVARTKLGERVVAAQHESAHEIRLKYPAGSLLCPRCQQSVFVRERAGFTRHFVHSTACTSSMLFHPESAEHDEGKRKLAELLRNEIGGKEVPGAKIEVEYPLPECGAHGRVADVAVVYENGNRLIYECQLAKITTNELEARTRDYHAIGADVLWFLGGEANTPAHRNWLRDTYGGFGQITFNYRPTSGDSDI